MTETKTVDQKIEELEKEIQSLKGPPAVKKVVKKVQKKETEKAKPKERLSQETFRVLMKDHNWKFVAGAIFAWFLLWIFSH